MKFNKLTYISLFGVILFASIILVSMILEPWKTQNERDFDEFQSSFESCEGAEKKAIGLFNDGIYIKIDHGLHEDCDRKAIYLKDKYRIQTIFGECVISPSMACYENKMNELLFYKFGLDAVNPKIQNNLGIEYK